MAVNRITRWSRRNTDRHFSGPLEEDLVIKYPVSKDHSSSDLKSHVDKSLDYEKAELRSMSQSD